MRERDYLQREREEQGPRIISPTEAEVAIEPLEAEVAISKYQEEKGRPYIADKLKLELAYNVDPQIKTKAEAVDRYILEKLQDEGLRDSEVGYETFLNRFVERYPTPVEMTIRAGKGIEILDFLFKEVALSNERSSETFLKEAEEEGKYQKVVYLTNQLKAALAQI